MDLRKVLESLEKSLNIILEEVEVETRLECAARIRGEAHVMMEILRGFEKRVSANFADLKETGLNDTKSQTNS
jgi:hypothetical protein